MNAIVIDRAKFYRAVRTDKPGDDVTGQNLFRSLAQQQVEGMDRWLDAWAAHPALTDIRFLAYILATNYWETGRRMWPVREIGKGKGRAYGKLHAPTHSGAKTRVKNTLIYYGRGDPQLTWFDNYDFMEKLLGYPLTSNPDLMLDPKISAEVTIEGMTRGKSSRGDFTGKSLEDFFNATTDDPEHARKIVNGMDHASDIAAIYKHFLYALKVSIGQAATKPVEKPPTEAEHKAAINVEVPPTPGETKAAQGAGAAAVTTVVAGFLGLPAWVWVGLAVIAGFAALVWLGSYATRKRS